MFKKQISYYLISFFFISIVLPQVVYAQQGLKQYFDLWSYLFPTIIIGLIVIVSVYYLRWRKSCNVSVTAIKFNHNTSSHNTDALNIRKNYKQKVSIPEWTSGKTNPKDSPAAYSIEDTKGKIVTVKVKLRIWPSTITSAEIKAVGGGVLGQIVSKTVSFSKGISIPEFVGFELKHNSISNSGIKIEDIKWKWMFRCKAHKTWTKMDSTQHRIYLILNEPVGPWIQQKFPHNQNPWMEVLEHSCDWAKGKTTPNDAASTITTMVNKPLGNVEYNTAGGGGSKYASTYFDCTAYLDRLNKGPGNGKYVACDDCASIVTTFSNILGCKLWSSRIRSSNATGAHKFFKINDIILIGDSKWSIPFKKGFWFHQVAAEGQNLTDNLFDACLKVNRNSIGAKVAELPLNVPLDDPKALDYREKLVAPGHRKDVKHWAGVQWRLRVQ